MKMEGNAKIIATMLGYEDHGILTCMIYLNQAGSSQVFGGYRLDSPNGDHVSCGFWIRRILNVVGVEKWEDLNGKYVRVNGSDMEIEGIGNIIENKWFYPKRELSELKIHTAPSD